MKTMIPTAFEQGLKDGMEQAIERLRKMLLRQLGQRFGPLSKEVEAKLEKCTADQLDDLSLAVLTAASLKDLGLD